MTENVFENAPQSLQQAKDETLAILRAEEARHESALEIENTYYASRKLELEHIIIMLDTRIPMPETPIPVVELPHSRACGTTWHVHGWLCSTDCPTCRGKRKMGGWE